MTDTLKIESDGFSITTVTHVETGLRFKSLAEYDEAMKAMCGEPIVIVDDGCDWPRGFTSGGRSLWVTRLTNQGLVNGSVSEDVASAIARSRIIRGRRYLIDKSLVETPTVGWLCVRDYTGPKYQPEVATTNDAIRALVDEAHIMAVSKGWHDIAWNDIATKAAAADRLGSLLALVHSEVSEALEAYRARELEAWTRVDGKPEGVAAELADVVIRVADLAGYLGIDLGAAIRGKMEFNATRPHRHGGKNL